MADTLTDMPASFYAGDTLAFTKTVSDYPASSGWTLKYAMTQSGEQILFSSSADGDDHKVEVAAAVTYRSGPIDIGACWKHVAWEVHPTSLFIRDDPDCRIHRDFDYDLGAVYLKYFNGRFFLNFEWDLMYGALRGRQNAAGFSPMNDSEFVRGLGVARSGSVF